MKKQEGFTLVETVITIAVGAIILSGIGLAAQTQIQQSVRMHDYLIAYQLAKKTMADVDNADYGSLTVGGPTTLSSDPSFPDFTVTQTITSVDTSGGDSLRRIQILVSTAMDGQLMELNTYRSNVVTFGDGS